MSLLEPLPPTPLWNGFSCTSFQVWGLGHKHTCIAWGLCWSFPVTPRQDPAHSTVASASSPFLSERKADSLVRTCRPGLGVLVYGSDHH